MKGDIVWLSTKNIQTEWSHKKLDHQFTGLFKVLEQVGKQVYQLKLPDMHCIHPVLHVFLLETYQECPGQDPGYPPPIWVDKEDE